MTCMFDFEQERVHIRIFSRITQSAIRTLIKLQLVTEPPQPGITRIKIRSSLHKQTTEEQRFKRGQENLLIVFSVQNAE